MATGRACEVNTTMQSLSKVHSKLKPILPGLEPGNVAHVRGVYCSFRALSGQASIHTHNGSYVAVVGDTVYASCISCSGEYSTKNALVEVLEGTEKSARPWVVYTQEVYKGCKRAGREGEDGQRRKASKGGTP
jgi:hypothetical protein